MNTKITKVHEGHEGLHLILMPIGECGDAVAQRATLIDHMEDAEGAEEAGEMH